MTYEEIDTIMQKKPRAGATFQIKFKTRNPMKGIFLQSADYNDLSKKNFWRIVSEPNIISYKQSQDESLSRIYNGSEITKLELLNEQ